MLEKAMISGVTHTLEEALYEVDGVRPAALFQALADAVGERGHDHPDRLRRSSSPRRSKTGPRPAGAQQLERAGHEQRRPREGERRRRRDEEPSGIAAKTFVTLDELGVEPRVRDHLADQDRLLRPARGRRANGRALHDAFELVVPRRRAAARMTRGSASSEQPAPWARSRSSCWRERKLRRRASASPRPVRPGKRVAFGGGELLVEEATPELLAAGDLDLAFFSVGRRPACELVPPAAAGGTVCIDKSDAYRLTDGIPARRGWCQRRRARTATGSSPTPTAPRSSSRAR